MDLNEAQRLYEFLDDGHAPSVDNPYAQAVRDYVASAHVEQRPLPSIPDLPHGGAGVIGTDEYEKTYEAQPCPLCQGTGAVPDTEMFGEHRGTPCVACFSTGWIPTIAACRKIAQRTQELQRLVARKVDGLKYFLVRSEGGPPQHAVMIHEKTGDTVELDDLDDPRQLAIWHAALGEARTHLVQLADLEYFLTIAAAQNSNRMHAITTLRGRLRQSVRAWDLADEINAALAGAEAPAAKAERCRTPGCKKSPKVWDTEGRGWCRPHAHRRGLLQRDPVPADTDG